MPALFPVPRIILYIIQELAAKLMTVNAKFKIFNFESAFQHSFENDMQLNTGISPFSEQRLMRTEAGVDILLISSLQRK